MDESQTMPERPTPLDDGDDLDAFVDEYDLALVEFYTDGCSICASMEPILGNVHRSTAATVGTINPRDDPPLVEEYDVRSVPKLLYFEDGDLVDTREDGFVPADDLVAFVGE